MRSARKMTPINESEYWADWAELQREPKPASSKEAHQVSAGLLILGMIMILSALFWWRV